MKRSLIKSLLIANRSEIAIRVMRAAAEMNIRTVAIYSKEDRLALHRFKADESYLVGEGKKPLAAYLDIDDILRVAKQAKVDAIHPGYGFLSENPDFAQAVIDAGIHWIGPSPEVMRTLGNKVAARNAAVAAGVPVMPATPPLPTDLEECKRLALQIGYPIMLKASWGGGGRGMRVLESERDLEPSLAAARREALSAFGNDEVYLEKLVRRARHVEVQILGDRNGNVVHLFERDCTVQRRNQKVVERAPAPYLDETQRQSLCDSALRLMRAVDYTHAGTVEFLMDAESGEFYFIEVNPRIQVEHTVTEVVTGVDIVKAQIRITEGGLIGHVEDQHDPTGRLLLRAAAVPPQEAIEPQRPRAAVPHHHRRPGERLPARLRHAHRLSQRCRLRRAARCRHRLWQCRHHALLRLAAGEGDHLGADLEGGDPAHGPQPARVPHPRRGLQPPVPGERDQPPGLRQRRGHHALHRHHARAARFREAARPRHQAAALPRRRDLERPSGDEGPQAARAALREACAAALRRCSPRRRRARATACASWDRRSSPSGCWSRSRCC